MSTHPRWVGVGFRVRVRVSVKVRVMDKVRVAFGRDERTPALAYSHTMTQFLWHTMSDSTLNQDNHTPTRGMKDTHLNLCNYRYRYRYRERDPNPDLKIQ